MNNNITIEQRKSDFEKFIESDLFNETVETILSNNIMYYDWLKKYILKGSKNKTQQAIDDGINYIYKCMVLDGYIKGNTTSVVYLIRNEYNGLLKIGKTNNLSRRMKEIEQCYTFLGMNTQKIKLEAISYCPFNTNNSQVESYYHNLYKENRVIGEWFNISYDQLFNDFDITMIIDKVLVSVEEPIVFPKGIKKVKLIEEDKNELRNEIKSQLLYDCGISFVNIDNYLMHQKNKNYEYAKDFYDYIFTLEKDEDLILENKVYHKIKQILSTVI